MSDQTPSILIIEDEALVAREIKSRLISLGYRVAGIASGMAGVALARETQPDLLLADIHLKDGDDGIEVARLIRLERQVPVVFLTAYSDDETVGRAKQLGPFGYIIKPVENRELEIVLEIALYKFSLERELAETRALLQTALTAIGNALVFVDQNDCIHNLNGDAEALLDCDRERIIGRPWREVIGLEEASSAWVVIREAVDQGVVTKLAPFLIHAESGKQSLVEGVLGPVEGQGGVLILREVSSINDLLVLPTGKQGESTFVELLIAPDAQPKSLNLEALLHELTAFLDQHLRATDLVARYVGEMISVRLPFTSEGEGMRIAQEILHTLAEMRFGGETVPFSIGLAAGAHADHQPIELFARARRALALAVASGGNRVTAFNDRLNRRAALGSREEGRDYQNLLLLWNVMGLGGAAADDESMLRFAVEHLQRSFRLEVAAFIGRDSQSLMVTEGLYADGDEYPRRALQLGDLFLPEAHFRAAKRMFGEDRAEYEVLDNGAVFPMSREVLFYLRAGEPLREQDYRFVSNLIDYLAATMSNRKVTAVANDSAPDPRYQPLVFQSRQMERVLQDATLVAETDATVLITGESGTGKGLIARTIHDESSRKDAPFIVVDCSAVVPGLIESELFGHVRGAFTGADSDFTGRLREASGGSVLLDEVGELSLEMQMKLLRFVEEHQVVAVGDSKHHQVDTRIIAATNRDIRQMSASGEFREDLFYRLNVFSIHLPPLRDRTDDILPLAEHYLAQSCRQLGRQVAGFTPDAEAALLAHKWPGNIRELLNLMTRSVILCKDNRINTIHLGLFAGDEQVPAEDVEVALAEALERTITDCVSAGTLVLLGTWLEEDIIKACIDDAAGVMLRAASTLGIPGTTLRRKWRKIADAEAHPRPDHWSALMRLIPRLIEGADGEGIGAIDVAERVLLAQLQKAGISRNEQAALMGVSAPTFRKMSS
jgi:DNA-binding NtrC family response regulator